MSNLQFAPFSSALDTGFWHQLSQNKLNLYKLDDTEKQIFGFYYNNSLPGLPCNLHLDHTAFSREYEAPPLALAARGKLKLFNTLDEFKNSDKKALLAAMGEQLWHDITSGRAVEDPGLLSRFYLLAFADLKKYHYFYWFVFPAFIAPEKLTLKTRPLLLSDRLSEEQVNQLLGGYDEHIRPKGCGYFLTKVSQDSVQVTSLAAIDSLVEDQQGDLLLCFCDPCTLSGHPGWPLRNLLTLASYHWSKKMTEVEILCFRDRIRDGKRSVTHSIVLKTDLPSISDATGQPQCVGWEKNERQKMGPRKVDLGASMDPSRLAEAAVDLNLKLMRWRLMPDLDLDKVAKTKCLLFGAGTLGCNVARNLLGWGVRNITLIDYGKISYSNPVRQSLFAFADSLQGGQPKAETAAEALKKIFPGVNAKGLSLSVPMPGHSVSSGMVEQVQMEVEQLERLVEEHDVMFLLMDTRESRWLPTLLGAAKGKLVINAALGFDTYLVVRHGLKIEHSSGSSSGTPSGGTSTADHFMNIMGSELGCYFCNDVVAPGDSTRDRTLDQQCTVSRPGMSMLTSALAVELMVTLLQHPLGGLAAADTSAGDDRPETDQQSALGIVPHQIRGFLSRYQQLLPATRAFAKCTACSDTVINKYKEEKFDFLLNVFNNPTYLEDLTGLTEMHCNADDAEVWELSDNESV